MKKFESVTKYVYNHWSVTKFAYFNGVHIACINYKDRNLLFNLFNAVPYPNFAHQIEESLYNSWKWKDNK